LSTPAFSLLAALAQERLRSDRYFDEITVERVNAGEGWERIEGLPQFSGLLRYIKYSQQRIQAKVRRIGEGI
jgi:hypothetical protein